MISAGLLACYALAAGTLGTKWLRAARWTRRTPRLAIAAWQALASSVLLAIGAAGLAMAVNLAHVRTDLAQLLNLCAESLTLGYAGPGGTSAAIFGIATFLALLTRTGWCATTATLTDRRARATRVGALDLVGRRDMLPGALVLDHAAPYAFCVGGRQHRVVVTTGLLNTLSDSEIAAVLEHEDAHLRQRHHLALLGCQILFATLAPFFTGFRCVMVDVRHFAELCADDSARQRVGAHHLRSALATLACRPAPAGALAASGTDVAARLHRLDEAQERAGKLTSAGASLGITAALLVPLALVAAPALTMAWEGICLLG